MRYNFYFFFPYKGRQEKSGIGWVNLVFTKAFPEGVELLALEDLLKLGKNSVVFIPRIFPQPLEGDRFNFAAAIAHTTRQTKAYVVQTPFWDSETVPSSVLATLGKVDILHAPSRFIDRLFQGVSVYGSVNVGIPIKVMKKRESAPSGKVCGAIIASLHPRKNVKAYFSLAKRLSQYKFRLVFPYPANVVVSVYSINMGDYPNVEILSDLTDEELRNFYNSLSCFLVLSGGEGYCLPAREALSVGVPVIAPRNTVFEEWANWDGVYLVDTTLQYVDEPLAKQQIYRFPKLEEVANLLDALPSMVREIEPPPIAPTIDEFRDKLLEGMERLLFQEMQVIYVNGVELKVPASKVSVSMGKEISSVWCVYPLEGGLGLTEVSKVWAQRCGGITIPILSFKVDDIPPNIPIIIPYRWGMPFGSGEQGGWENQILNFVATVFRKHPSAILCMWLHSWIPENLVYLLRSWGVKFITTHPEYAKKLGAACLPNPIGTPPAGGEEGGDYFLVWGCNYYQLAIIKEILTAFFKAPSPILIQFSINMSIPQHIVHDVINPLLGILSERGGGVLERKVKFVVSPILFPDEVESLIDNAKGYIILDDDKVALPWETSAKIPWVLRKGKPIIANDGVRLSVWREHVPLLPFNPKQEGWASIATELLDRVWQNLDDFVPRRVPTLSQEIEWVFSVLSQLKFGG